MLRRSIREFVTSRDFTAQFSNRLLTKDLRLYAQEARGLGTSTPAGAPALDLYEQAMVAGLEAEDYASVLKLIER
jgi:3-hydroxyisobutyrate dehydrogenase-like beta-hydroxyacid dehydrogenase